MLPEEILAELSSVTHAIPVAALYAANEHRDALTQPLLDALRRFVERTLDPVAIDDEQNTLPDMAMYLLAQFREPRAFTLYETLCRLPEERGDYWLGDLLLQDFASFLASTCEGNPTPLKRMAEDQSLHTYARWTALDALLTLVANGAWSRTKMIAWLGELWPSWQASGADPELTPLASVACDLAAAELLPQARAAYAAGQTDWRDVDMAELEQRCALGDHASVGANELRRHYVDDPAKQMSWQSRFSKDRGDWDGDDLDGYELQEPYVRPMPKIGRNDPCICGSGKKYKKCCMLGDDIAITDFAVRQ